MAEPPKKKDGFVHGRLNGHATTSYQEGDQVMPIATTVDLPVAGRGCCDVKCHSTTRMMSNLSLIKGSGHLNYVPSLNKQVTTAELYFTISIAERANSMESEDTKINPEHQRQNLIEANF